jgi:hypothetical protein
VYRPVAPGSRLLYGQVEEAALRAASKDRHDAYDEEHVKIIPLDKKSRLFSFEPRENRASMA